MFVGPNHPIFGGRGSGSPGTGMGIPGNRNRGPWGGDGYLPPMGAPPGARFDPVGPGLGFPGGGGIGPFSGGGGMGGFGGIGGPRRPNLPGGTGDPDNDEFMPPGAVCLPSFCLRVSECKLMHARQFCRKICTCKELCE